MKLEDQLATLREQGVELAPGVTIDDVLYSFGREDYERRPFDTECIEGDGAYVAIAEQLCRVAGRPGAFTNLQDHVDLETGEAWVAYTVDGQDRRWTVEVNDDWADTLVVAYMMGDLERDGFMFRSKDNGQAMVLFYLDAAGATKLSELSGQKLVTVTAPEA